MDPLPFPRGFTLAGKTSKGGIDKESLEELEAKLESILHDLAAGKNLTDIRLRVRRLCNEVAHTENAERRIGVEKNKLLQPDWEATWSRYRQVYTALFLHLGRIVTIEQADYLYAAFRELVHFVADGKTDHLRLRIAQELHGALGDYLSLRGYSVPPWPAQGAQRAAGFADLSDAGLGTPSTAPVESKRATPKTVEAAVVDRDRLQRIKERIDPDGRYIGKSVAILRVFERIDEFNRRADEPVLILGPTGAGKTELAQLIHSSSDRRSCPLEPVHASETMAEDKAFVRQAWMGYGPKAGIQDGDPNGRPGLLKDAEGGTIFIDDVDALPKWFQVMLFPVLDHCQVRPFSAGEPFTPNVRLILATNQNLDDAATTGEFRHDFLRRIRGNAIRIPALRERIEDVFDFAQAECGEHPRSPGFLLCLVRYSWPENVGELLQALRAAVSRVSSPEQELTTDHLELWDASIIKGVADMPETEQKRELLGFLENVLKRQGFEKGKRGAGLQQRMAGLLGISKTALSRMLKSREGGQ